MILDASLQKQIIALNHIRVLRTRFKTYLDALSLFCARANQNVALALSLKKHALSLSLYKKLMRLTLRLKISYEFSGETLICLQNNVNRGVY